MSFGAEHGACPDVKALVDDRSSVVLGVNPVWLLLGVARARFAEKGRSPRPSTSGSGTAHSRLQPYRSVVVVMCQSSVEAFGDLLR
jgi:hypothetical protein